MRVKDLFDVPGLGLRLLADVAGMDRTVRHVYTTDLPDPSRYLTPGDLVLTGLMWCHGPGDADLFMAALDRAGVAALGAGEALGQVPAEVIQACGRHGIPLLAVPAKTSFAAVTEEVGRRLNGDRATAMTRVLGRRRLLLSAVAEGAGLDAMFRLMGREIGAECWLLTALGRVVGGTGPSLAEPLALRLAGEYLKADRLPAVARSARRGRATGRTRCSGWAASRGSPAGSWPARGASRTGRTSCGSPWPRWPRTWRSNGPGSTPPGPETASWPRRSSPCSRRGGEGAAPAEIASLMRAAGLPPDGRYLVAALAAEADRMTGPNAERWRRDLAEELAVPLAEGALAAPLGEEVIVLVPAPGDWPRRSLLLMTVPARTCRGRDPRGVEPVVAVRPFPDQGHRRGQRPRRGRDRAGRRADEAGSARRLAALRGAAAVSVVTSNEVASHELLLATVPPSVLRSFRERLLGPLLAYDDRHRAELLPTLREFLACSGSWNACAAKMYVHVNTVRYRIRRIEELTGRDLSWLDDQVDFFLALQIR